VSLVHGGIVKERSGQPIHYSMVVVNHGGLLSTPTGMSSTCTPTAHSDDRCDIPSC